MALTILEDTFATLDYAESRNSASEEWNLASVSQKEAALRAATVVLDDNTWIGEAVASTQTLSWPRRVVSYYDRKLGLDVEIAEGEVPRRLSDATSNLARHFIEYPESESDYNPTFDRIKLGPLEIEDTDISQRIPKVPYSTVTRLLAPILLDEGTQAWRRVN